MELLEILASAKTEYGNFYAGERRMCEPEAAEMLKRNGWAKPFCVELEVQDAKVGITAEDAS